ncbi:MAG TPA: formyltransferase family protein [Candidatus Paceibacterota bacterium]|nr:formyltransferase family protein [Candidatus Paceibacterota bacterium]
MTLQLPKNDLEKEIRLALLISGGGTTMEAIIKATKNGTLTNVNPVLVIASKETAGGIEKAKALGISGENIIVLERKKFKDSVEFGEAIISECEKRNVNMIGQYGWMVLTPQNVIKRFEKRIVNQHPGPLDTGRPDFGGEGMYGLRVHEARRLFVKNVNRDFFTEATCHYVTEEFDKGEVIKRNVMEFSLDDLATDIQQKLLPIEHQTQIEALQDIASDRIEIFKREIPLVNEGEEEILKECKQSAKLAYPNG